MDEIVKHLLLGLLFLPITVMFTDAIGKTEKLMLRVVIGVVNRYVDCQGSECSDFLDLDWVFDSDHELVFGQRF
jgi:hypothetical protein